MKADRISSGKVCIYEIQVYEGADDELLELTVEHIHNAKLGFDFVQGNQSVESGFLSRDNCSMEFNNCTLNMRGKQVYYLSGVADKVYLTVIAANNTELNGETSFVIDFALREKTTNVWF